MITHYTPFEILIELEPDGNYSILADYQGRKRRAVIPASLPGLKKGEIEQAHTWLRQGYFNLTFAKDFGSRLFKTLFSGEVLELYRTALAELEKDAGLRLLLDLPLPAGLDRLPWELLYDEKGGLGFLARSIKAPLARHYTDLGRMHAIPTESPLRVLVVAASPPDLPPISTDPEITAIQQAFNKTSLSWSETLQMSLGYLQQNHSLAGLQRHLKQRRRVEYNLLPHATYEMLQGVLLEAKNRQQPVHVVHFIGHGQGGARSNIIFESTDEAFSESGEPVPAEAFAELMSEDSISLVVLNACETAGTGLIEGAAREIQRKGVPAVVGMQTAILDRAALAFAEQFYGAWALGEPLESALAYGRRQIPDERQGSAADWVIPALFMGPQDGLNLRFETPKVRTPRSLKWAWAAFGVIVFLIGAVAALLSVPALARQVRMEAPLIRCWWPYPMEAGDHFNVAVAEFTVRDASGRSISDPNGQVLANDIYTRLDAESQALGSSSFVLRPLPLICPLRGSADEAIDHAAVELAEKLHTDILIYGVIDQTAPDAGKFTPRFLITATGFEQGEEITGPHKLGDPLDLDLPLDPAKVRAGGYQGVNVRDAALVQIVQGLVNYALDKQDAAIDNFDSARSLPGLRDKWGKDFIYLMLGNAYGQKSARLLELPDYETYVKLINQAIASLNEALRINPEYARAQIGLAESTRRLAQNPFDPGQPYDLAMLDDAEAAFKKALTMHDQPESANIPAKMHFGLGMIELMRAGQAQMIETVSAQPAADLAAAGLVGSVEGFDRAGKEFNEVINIWQMNDENPKTQDARLNSQAAHAFISLAWVAAAHGEPEQAAEAVEQAVELASPYYRGRYLILLGQVYEQAANQPAACAAYRRAANTANLIGDDPTTAEAAEGKLVELNCE